MLSQVVSRQEPVEENIRASSMSEQSKPNPENELVIF